MRFDLFLLLLDQIVDKVVENDQLQFVSQSASETPGPTNASIESVYSSKVSIILLMNDSTYR